MQLLDNLATEQSSKVAGEIFSYSNSISSIIRYIRHIPTICVEREVKLPLKSVI